MGADIEKRLESKNIRPTAVRLLVAEMLSGASSPLSLPDLEALLPTVPKSSIFRALNLFNEHHICIVSRTVVVRHGTKCAIMFTIARPRICTLIFIV